MQAYVNKDLDVDELKKQAKQQWEARGHVAEPDLGLMTRADIHGDKSELRSGHDALIATQAEIQSMTGSTTLTEESRQYLLTSVSAPFSGTFPGTFFSPLVPTVPENVLVI